MGDPPSATVGGMNNPKPREIPILLSCIRYIIYFLQVVFLSLSPTGRGYMGRGSTEWSNATGRGPYVGGLLAQRELQRRLLDQ